MLQVDRDRFGPSEMRNNEANGVLNAAARRARLQPSSIDWSIWQRKSTGDPDLATYVLIPRKECRLPVRRSLRQNVLVGISRSHRHGSATERETFTSESSSSRARGTFSDGDQLRGRGQGERDRCAITRRVQKGHLCDYRDEHHRS